MWSQCVCDVLAVAVVIDWGKIGTIYLLFVRLIVYFWYNVISSTVEWLCKDRNPQFKHFCYPLILADRMYIALNVFVMQMLMVIALFLLPYFGFAAVKHSTVSTWLISIIFIFQRISINKNVVRPKSVGIYVCECWSTN